MRQLSESSDKVFKILFYLHYRCILVWVSVIAGRNPDLLDKCYGKVENKERAIRIAIKIAISVVYNA